MIQWAKIIDPLKGDSINSPQISYCSSLSKKYIKYINGYTILSLIINLKFNLNDN